MEFAEVVRRRRMVRHYSDRPLAPEVVERIERAAVKAFRALRLQDYARIDIRLAADGTPYFLEANPNADIGYGEEFAEAAEAAGIDYEPLLDRILAIGLRKR
jgi:D-alanine-D-alanine ligase